ncbi:hypothetical protein AYO44_01275 [Planctomycetaceae bacterium SCGC AG-212-F19]|nr:hypothetical protein AYO44_01275 [Planctomycetaceae bacterium SCGC AG-212-F19]
MWRRNLLFIGLVVGGFLALRASLFPLRAARGPVPAEASAAIAPVTVDPVVGEVNAAFRAQWDKQNLKAAPPAPQFAVVRRLSLVLTGTIPSLEELRQLEQVPPERQVDWWLDHLLRDRRFADYFAERLARTYVGTEDGPFIVYRRRRFVSWLSDQLIANRPYGELVRELIAADGLWTDHPATNFITVTIQENKVTPERLAARVTRAFLGVRLDCAQCHDAKFEPWTQKDFHGLAAFFGQTKQGFTGIYDAREGEHKMEIHATGKKEVVGPAVPFNADLLPTDGTPRSQLARWVTDPRNEYFARATAQRVWALMFGRSMKGPVDSVNGLDNLPTPLLVLARDFTVHNHDLHRLIRVIAATEVFRMDSAAPHEITEAHEEAWAAFGLTRLRPEQVVGAVQQAASVKTIDRDSNFFVRLAYYGGEKDFVRRYGDTGEDEFAGQGGTIPQRLILMNGSIVKEKTKDELFNAANLIAGMAADDHSAVEIAYLVVLTRKPTTEEAQHFAKRLEGSKGKDRAHRMEDIYWTLINSTEFSWNH